MYPSRRFSIETSAIPRETYRAVNMNYTRKYIYITHRTSNKPRMDELYLRIFPSLSCNSRSERYLRISVLAVAHTLFNFDVSISDRFICATRLESWKQIYWFVRARLFVNYNVFHSFHSRSFVPSHLEYWRFFNFPFVVNVGFVAIP